MAVNLFRFIENHSLLHQIPASTKILILVIMSISIMSFSWYGPVSVLICILLFVLLLTCIERNLLYFQIFFGYFASPFVLFMLLVVFLLPNISLIPIRLSFTTRSINIILQLSALLMLSHAFVCTTRISEIRSGIIELFPGFLFRFSSFRRVISIFSYMFSMVFFLIPQLQEAAIEQNHAFQMRTRKKRTLKTYSRFILTLIFKFFEMVSESSWALSSRFTLLNPRQNRYRLTQSLLILFFTAAYIAMNILLNGL
jgi:energy-coupling factor transporter transmembrane protein EcfT